MNTLKTAVFLPIPSASVRTTTAETPDVLRSLIGAAATLERTVVLKVAGVAESLVVEGSGSRIEARKPRFRYSFRL